MFKRTSRIERLSRKEETKVVKRIVYLSIFSIILAVFLITLGIPILGKFADFLNLVFRKNEISQVDTKSTPRVPILDILPQATNSASLAISGFSQDETKVVIYNDLQNVGEAEVESGKFQFENLKLKDGQNEISAKAISKSGKESDFSGSVKIILDKEPPKLEVDTPSEGQSFSQDNRIKVSGKTDKDAQVYANGFLASVTAEGNFEVLVPVLEGETTIEIKATDDAGNTKVESRKVNFKK
ncbi:MAG: hypothetical protein A3G66_01440 [Candidatus Levybacteria bacterium RIFCSPLOWO2_12_FULL_39_17]|nr:MAG: hypothetical protein A3G66_01440 [Candidatus Levybacteria bacterium RIFCSPLOWO2_12_FULL_39_17]